MDEKYRYSVYTYSKGYDGSLELMNLQSFNDEGTARTFYRQQIAVIQSGSSLANCVELNKDVFHGDDLFMSTSVNVEHFERRTDFAV